LARDLGQPVIVENRGGVGTLLGSHAVARAQPDGHTLLVAAAALTISPHLYKTPAVDPSRDFQPIRTIARFPNVVVVNTESPVRTVSDLISKARAKPGEFNYSSGGVGISEHLSAELFQSLTSTRLTHIPYKSSAASVLAVVSGETLTTFGNLAVALPQIRAGKLRPIAVTGAQRSPSLPDVPTLAEAGVDGYEVSTWFALLAPAGMAPGLVRKLDEAARRVLANPEVRERMLAAGAELIDEGPEQLASRIRREHAKWGIVVKAANVRVD
jgi:tripartite-type tricarboxylate transporter receptor subunit TctC